MARYVDATVGYGEESLSGSLRSFGIVTVTVRDDTQTLTQLQTVPAPDFRSQLNLSDLRSRTSLRHAGQWLAPRVGAYYVMYW